MTSHASSVNMPHASHQTVVPCCAYYFLFSVISYESNVQRHPPLSRKPRPWGCVRADTWVTACRITEHMASPFSWVTSPRFGATALSGWNGNSFLGFRRRLSTSWKPFPPSAGQDSWRLEKRITSRLSEICLRLSLGIAIQLVEPPRHGAPLSPISLSCRKAILYCISAGSRISRSRLFKVQLVPRQGDYRLQSQRIRPRRTMTRHRYPELIRKADSSNAIMQGWTFRGGEQSPERQQAASWSWTDGGNGGPRSATLPCLQWLPCEILWLDADHLP